MKRKNIFLFLVVLLIAGSVTAYGQSWLDRIKDTTKKANETVRGVNDVIRNADETVEGVGGAKEGVKDIGKDTQDVLGVDTTAKPAPQQPQTTPAQGTVLVQAQESGFTIIGFPGYARGEEQWRFYVSYNDNITTYSDFMSDSRGYGDVQNDGKVIWGSTPITDNDYTLYLARAYGTIMKTASTVNVSAGGIGRVNYTAFVVVKP